MGVYRYTIVMWSATQELINEKVIDVCKKYEVSEEELSEALYDLEIKFSSMDGKELIGFPLYYIDEDDFAVELEDINVHTLITKHRDLCETLVAAYKDERNIIEAILELMHNMVHYGRKQILNYYI